MHLRGHFVYLAWGDHFISQRGQFISQKGVILNPNYVTLHPKAVTLNPNYVTLHPKGHDFTTWLSPGCPASGQRGPEGWNPQGHWGVTDPPFGGVARFNPQLINTQQRQRPAGFSGGEGTAGDTPRAHLHCQGGWRCLVQGSPHSLRWPRPSPRGSCPPLGRPRLPPLLPGNLWGQGQ